MKTPGQKYLTVCIPTYEMGGVGHVFLRKSLDVLLAQSFRDFDVVISDYSKDQIIEKLCADYAPKLPLHYSKNTDPVGGMGANTNNAMRQATGRIIKILLQDDFLSGPESLRVIAENFNPDKDVWLATGCRHTMDGKTFFQPHYPKYNTKIYLGRNTIGSPSVLSVRNDPPLQFDPRLKWLVDCDYYRRYHDLAGNPRVVRDVGVIIRMGEHQITNTEATVELRKNEQDYVARKFAAVSPRKSCLAGWLSKFGGG